MLVGANAFAGIFYFCPKPFFNFPLENFQFLSKKKELSLNVDGTNN